MKLSRSAAISLGLILISATLFAADHNVDFDRQVDFSKIKTFKFRSSKIAIQRPEINNAIVVAKITDAVRTTLASKGLKETTERADVVVDFTKRKKQ